MIHIALLLFIHNKLLPLLRQNSKFCMHTICTALRRRAHSLAANKKIREAHLTEMDCHR